MNNTLVLSAFQNLEKQNSRLIRKWQEFWNPPKDPEVSWLLQRFSNRPSTPSPHRRREESLYLLVISSWSRCM